MPYPGLRALILSNNIEFKTDLVSIATHLQTELNTKSLGKIPIVVPSNMYWSCTSHSLRSSAKFLLFSRRDIHRHKVS